MAARQELDDRVIDPVGQAAQQALVLDRRQFGDLYRIARPAQQPAVGDLLAVDVEQTGAGAGRLDQAAHHLARQVGQQDLALRVQRLDLLADQARFELAEVQETDRQQRQRQHIDGDDPPRQRRHPPPAEMVQPVQSEARLAPALRRRARRDLSA